jgi:hypothetical protein
MLEERILELVGDMQPVARGEFSTAGCNCFCIGSKDLCAYVQPLLLRLDDFFGTLQNLRNNVPAAGRAKRSG